MKASKCVQSLKKSIKNLTEPFEGSEFYPMAEPSPPEPFFKFRRAKKGSGGNIQNPDGSGLSSNGFVRSPRSPVLNPILLVQNRQGSVCFCQNLFFLCETLKRVLEERVLSNFLSFFLDFGRIWKLSLFCRTFFRGSVILLFYFQRMCKSIFT